MLRLMSTPTPRPNETGIFIPLNQSERDSPLPPEEILTALGEIGLHGRPLNLSDVISQEILLPYNLEQQPSLGVASYDEFETFAYVRHFPKGLPMKIWSSFARLSEKMAYVTAASRHGTSRLYRKYEIASQELSELNYDPYSGEPFFEHQARAIEQRTDAKERMSAALAALAKIDARVRNVSEQHGNGRHLLTQLADSATHHQPFIYIDLECTQPLESHTGSQQRVNRPNAMRSTFVSVDDMYQLVANMQPGESSRIRGAKFDQVTIPFLNARITQATAH
jgi:hypothetical protein